MSTKRRSELLVTLVRHTEPSRSAADRSDPGLSEVGREQARTVAGQLGAGGALADAVLYSSPMRRARETAAAIAAVADLPVALDEALVEFDHGADYQHFEDGAEVWERYFAGDLSPWGTTLPIFAARVQGAMNRLAERHPGNHVVAVCHGGVINTWAAQVLGRPERVRVLEPGYGSVSRFRNDGAGRWFLESLNEQWVPQEQVPRQVLDSQIL